MKRASPPLSKARAEDRYGEGEAKRCPRCNTWHSRHNPPLCFACAVGLDPH